MSATTTIDYDTAFKVEIKMKNSDNDEFGRAVKCTGGPMPCTRIFDGLGHYGEVGTKTGDATKAALTKLQQAWAEASQDVSDALEGKYELCMGIIDNQLVLVAEEREA